MSTRAGALWDKGYFVIVPLVDDDASFEEVMAWYQKDPKRYEIRVIDIKARGMDKLVNYTSDRVWNELDGQEIMFRSDFRPRAQYLYFKYCLAMLRRSWQNEN